MHVVSEQDWKRSIVRSWNEVQGFWVNRKVMVTGAAGFLGSHLCHQLSQAGAILTCIDDLSGSAGPIDNTLQSHHVLPYKIQDSEFCALVSNNVFDVIFHLAGEAYAAKSVTDPLLDFESNLRASVYFLDSLRRGNFHGHLVYTSSAAVYGEPKTLPITEDTPPSPISPYGVSKLSSEHYIRTYSQLFNFGALISRLFSLYGPGQRKQVVFDITRKALQFAGQIELLGHGTEVRDFLYVEDAAAALMYLASLTSQNSGIYNVCSGQGISIRRLAEMIIQILGEDIKRLHFTDRRRPGDPVAWIGSNQLLTHMGFRPKFDFSRGLELTVDWYRKYL